MPFLIGTDEAGYGPNLGPLTITGTLWESSDLETDLYALLHQIVSPDRARTRKQPSIQIADSKRVYQSSGSIQNLESGVLSLLYCATGKIPADWRELANLVCPPDTLSQLNDQLWLRDQALELPIKSPIKQIKEWAEAFLDTSRRAEVKLMEIQCTAVFPPEFNRLVNQLGNKATLLSLETLAIVRRLKDQTDDDLEIGCDKHGGRSRYAALIQENLTDSTVWVGDETSQSSDYCFREQDRDVSIRFQAKGESFLPTALASMVSKYVREVFMMLWNSYWRDLIPEIKPTKGYPVDALRFKSDIQAVQNRLGIDDEAIWRNR